MDMHSMSMQAMTSSMHAISDGQTAAGIIVTGLIAFAFFGLAAGLFMRVARAEAKKEAQETGKH
ncbi:hypothetical protein HHS34_010970 [Acidithiobacillus montserratensis]|uniref:Uncharacterized protein n=1 Tax=Acidithiobacillus montserratensis TaxID=2729135 RepID=A0ACD5HDF6_9PROT|nr:hypothetical protein [Acidithiobacillus montserratensis]MBU2747458.1 hypothetical protein [Acidithiobacillus montserratensis]